MVSERLHCGGLQCPVAVYPYNRLYQDCVNCQIMKAAKEKEPSYQHLRNILGVKESYRW